MASVTISGSNDWSGHTANRVLSATVSADVGSGTASYSVSSKWTYTYGSYTRVRLDINGQQVFDTGYAKNFNQFPCKQNSTNIPFIPYVPYISFCEMVKTHQNRKLFLGFPEKNTVEERLTY